jgi:hypothetical protein
VLGRISDFLQNENMTHKHGAFGTRRPVNDPPHNVEVERFFHAVVTRLGLILLHVEAMPLQRMTGCASLAHGRATSGSIPSTQARLQRQSARIFNRSGDAERYRASDNTGTVAGQILKYS